MGNENSKKKLNVIYLILGIFGLVIAIFDSVVKNYFDAVISTGWGALIIFIGLKTWLESKLSSKSVKIIHYILLVIVIIASIAKLIYRLNTLDFAHTLFLTP